MVTKYSKNGTPYNEPPYSEEEERELDAFIDLPPVVVIRTHPDQRRAPREEEEAVPKTPAEDTSR